MGTSRSSEKTARGPQRESSSRLSERRDSSFATPLGSATASRGDAGRKAGWRLGNPRDRTQCRFCRRGEKYIDYKDVDTLSKLLTHRGKIYSRKRSGNCASCQRKAKRAIKLARYVGLLPYSV